MYGIFFKNYFKTAAMRAHASIKAGLETANFFRANGIRNTLQGLLALKLAPFATMPIIRDGRPTTLAPFKMAVEIPPPKQTILKKTISKRSVATNKNKKITKQKSFEN